MNRLGIPCFALLLLPAISPAAVTTLTSVRDTSLFQNDPDSNLGASSLAAGTTVHGEKSRALFQFDLTSLPSDATIISVNLQLSVTRTPTTPSDSIFGIYTMYTNWSEGRGNSNGAVGLTGETTWNDQYFGLTPWSVPGAAAGINFSLTTSATTAIAGIGTYTFLSTPQMVADVQSWLLTPTTNFGYMLSTLDESAGGTARRFGSREVPGSAAAAPTLIVTYSTIPEPTTLALVIPVSFWLYRRRFALGTIRAANRGN